MKSAKQPIGRVVFTSAQQNAAQPGGFIDIPADQFRQRVKGTASLRDLIWVQEGWIVMEHKKNGSRHVRVGPMARWRNDLPKGVHASDCRFVRDRIGNVAYGDPTFLRRADSCLTLEIVGYTDAAVRCLIHEMQVDLFLKTGATA